MKIIRYIAVALLTASFAVAAVAQEKSTSSTVRKRKTSDRNKENSVQVSPRMQSFYEEQQASDADVQWMKVIYRQLDLKKEQNMALYYPEEPNQDGMNLFCIIMKLIADDQLTVYEYLDGREIFTDQYKVKVREMLDRFHILYTEAKGSTEKHPKFKIEDADIPSNEVLSYYIIEKWEFDRVSTKMQHHVQAICPVLHRTDEFGGEAVRYPMFWMKLADLSPYLAQQYIFIDDDNNLPKYTYDDFFTLSMYDGDIYKTRNLTNKSMMQMFPDPDDRKRAQDSIQNRLDTFDKNIWVPSREEVIAAREAREAAEAEAEAKAAEADAIADRDASPGESAAAAASDGDDSSKKSVRSSRGRKSSSAAKKQKKEKKPKATKPKAPKKSSSNAVRSVRRRK